MGPEVVNKNRNCTFNGPYAGRDLYITMYQESEREFVVTHNANIKPVSYFTGRETELQELRQRIEEGRKSVLVSGMGGIGKTQICRLLFDEYMIKNSKGGIGKTQICKMLFNKFRVKNSKGANGSFSHIGYIEYNEDMGSSLQNCLKYKQQDSPEKNQEAAWRELEYLASNGKLLLFVDNVNVSMGEDPGLKRLMSIPGVIVLTSRRRAFSKEFEPYRIGFISTEKCREIYEKIRFENSRKRVAKNEVPDLEYIIDILAARHTITIELLAHLAWTKQWTVQELRDKLEENGFRLEYMDEEDKLVNIQKSYETLYDISVLTEAEQNVLEAFSIFPYIPLEAEICYQWLLVDAGVKEDDDILIGLYRKGWLQFDMEQKSYAMHPVFAQFIYEKCRPTIEKHAGLIEAFRRSLQIPESGSMLECQKYVPFAENMIDKLGMENNLGQTNFISAIADLLYHVAEYKKAEALYEKDLRISEKILGEDHPDTATSYNNLAMMYNVQGEYGKAELLLEKGLRIMEKVLGEDHPNTVISYNNLAVVYENQGEYEKAKLLLEKSLRLGEKVLGEDHPDIALSYNNLAEIYMFQKKYSKAKELYTKSLQIREKVFGEEHPDTATSYNSLAGVYRTQGKYEKAKELYEKSLRIREKVLGEEHPDTAISYNDLALVYGDWGECEKAESLHEKSLRIREKVFGEDHPETAISYNSLALVYGMQGEYGKAEQLYEKGLRIREKVFGEEHPYTAIIYNNLAEVYRMQGEYGKAEQLHEKSLRINEKILGEDHPKTAISYNNLALVYKAQREYQKAMTHYLKAYNILMVKLGVGHPNTQLVYENMKIVYSKLNPEGIFNQWLKEQMKE